MPFELRKQGGKYCVFTQGTDKNHGCHPDRKSAIRHMRALYVNVPEARSASMEETMVAAGTPVAPPRDWFFRPEPDIPTPMTYEDSGQVYGHLALNDTCHRGFMGGSYAQCVKPPSSRTDYAQFHLGHVVTAEGDSVPVGKITFDAPHASMEADIQAASRHYDHTGSVGAYVRATNGRRGIWLSGALRPDLAPEDLVTLRANPLSGDWRSLNRNLELVAALAVPVPGFPIIQQQLAASADGDVTTLILGEVIEEVEEEEEVMEASIRTEDELRKFRMAKKQREAVLAGGVVMKEAVKPDEKEASVLTLADRRMLRMIQNAIDTVRREL